MKTKKNKTEKMKNSEKSWMNFIFLISLIAFVSCQKEEPQKIVANTSVTFDSYQGEKQVAQQATEDNFDDLKEQKKDESCATTEDIEKELEKKAKSLKAVSLQGGSDSDCTVGE